jgi:hypothetical protein
MLLGLAFQKLLSKLGDAERGVYEIALENVSIVDRMMNIINVLEASPAGVTFEQLVPELFELSAERRALAGENSDSVAGVGGEGEMRQLPPLTAKARSALLATFLALLELCKRQAILVFQEETFSQIAISLSSNRAGISAARNNLQRGEGAVSSLSGPEPDFELEGTSAEDTHLEDIEAEDAAAFGHAPNKRAMNERLMNE